MDYMIERRCCTCNKYLGQKRGGCEPGMISHSYCDNCLIKIQAELAKLKESLKNEKESHNE